MFSDKAGSEIEGNIWPSKHFLRWPDYQNIVNFTVHKFINRFTNQPIISPAVIAILCDVLGVYVTVEFNSPAVIKVKKYILIRIMLTY